MFVYRTHMYNIYILCLNILNIFTAPMLHPPKTTAQSAHAAFLLAAARLFVDTNRCKLQSDSETK